MKTSFLFLNKFNLNKSCVVTWVTVIEYIRQRSVTFTCKVNQKLNLENLDIPKLKLKRYSLCHIV